MSGEGSSTQSPEEVVQIDEDNHRIFDNAEKVNNATIYEPKQTPKIIRVLTVCGYILSVSLAAIILSSYYVLMWQPPDFSNHTNSRGENPQRQQQLEGSVLTTMSSWPTTARPSSSEEIIYDSEQNNLSPLSTNSLLISKLKPNYDSDTNLISNETLYK